MVERIWDFFSLKKPSFPTSREESINFLLERRRKEAKKLWLTFEEYDSIRRMRKERYIKQSYVEFTPKEIVNISWYENSNWIKNWKILLKNKCWKILCS